MDLVFKALADPSRRVLLDRLQVADGQTLKRLCVDLAMTRQAVTKHLTLLVAAKLVKISWKGREKLHFLNSAPLQQIATHWINKYERPQSLAQTSTPHTLRHSVEAEGESHWSALHKFDLTVL